MAIFLYEWQIRHQFRISVLLRSISIIENYQQRKYLVNTSKNQTKNKEKDINKQQFF